MPWLEGFPVRSAKVRRSSLPADRPALADHQDMWGTRFFWKVIAPIITVWLLSAAPVPVVFVELVVPLVPQAASSNTSDSVQ